MKNESDTRHNNVLENIDEHKSELSLNSKGSLVSRKKSPTFKDKSKSNVKVSFADINIDCTKSEDSSTIS